MPEDRQVVSPADSDRYFASGLVRGCFISGVVLSLLSIVVQVSEPRLLDLFVVAQLIMGAFFAWLAWALSTRPLFAISPAGVELSNGAGGKLLAAVPWSEITGVQWENNGAICLSRQNSPAVTLNLFMLSRQRRASLRQRVHAHLSSCGIADR